MAKVILDAGHGGSDPGAVYQGRREKDDTLRLTQAVGEILQNNGVDVVYTRTTDIYQTPLEKSQIANQTGGDLFVSIHRNSSENPNTYNGVETLIYNRGGLKEELAEAVNNNLEEIGFRNIGVKERPNLAVLRRTNMPAILIEAGFLNTDSDNVLFDGEFDAIAQAIADAILTTMDIQQMPVPSYYSVQVGLFRYRSNAVTMENQLISQGFPAYIVNADGYYSVHVGAYTNLDNAIAMEQKLLNYGYSTLIVR